MWTKTAVHLDATATRPEGWHYAQVWSDGGGPIGYCREHDPHPTEAEARTCYSAYLRAHVRLDDVRLGDWTGCQVEGCDTPTKGGAGYDGYHFVALCDQHRTLDHAVHLLGVDGPAGDSMGS